MCNIGTIFIYFIESSVVVSGKIIDLSHGFSQQTNYWTTATPFSFTHQTAGYDSNGQWYAMNDFCAGEHGGTHLDAPYHFHEHGWTVDQIPLAKLFASGIRIDVSNKTIVNADYELTIQDIQNWETQNGQIPNNSVVLIDFGWAKHYGNRTKYFGLNENNSSMLRFPGISLEAATYFVETEKVVGVGVDTLSVDKGQSTDFATHAKLASGGLYNLENVALNGNDIPLRDFKLLVMPMKIVNGTGAPCRIFAITNE